MNTEQKFNVINTLNYNFKENKGEINKKPSQTVPDQTMSIREILVRYAKGLPIEAGKVPIYEGEDYTPDPRYMDLADREEYMNMAKMQLKEIQENQQIEQPKQQVEDTTQVS